MSVIGAMLREKGRVARFV